MIQQHPWLSVFLVIIVIYGLIVFGMYKSQRRLLYHPDQTIPMPADYGLSVGTEVVRIPAHDGLLLHSWYRPPLDNSNPVVILFHGNAGHIGNRAHQLRFFRDQGYGFLAASYRYNAGAGGSPSEDSLLKDAQAIINWARMKGIRPEQLIFYGESLGSGIAISLAQNNISRAVILEGPYSSITDVAADRYWYLPVNLLIKDTFKSHDYIGNLIPPVLILHGAEDRTIPLKFAEKLYDHGNKAKDRLVVFPEGGHVDLYDYGAAEEILAFINDNPAPSD